MKEIITDHVIHTEIEPVSIPTYTFMDDKIGLWVSRSTSSLTKFIVVFTEPGNDAKKTRLVFDSMVPMYVDWESNQLRVEDQFKIDTTKLILHALVRSLIGSGCSVCDVPAKWNICYEEVPVTGDISQRQVTQYRLGYMENEDKILIEQLDCCYSESGVIPGASHIRTMKYGKELLSAMAYVAETKIFGDVDAVFLYRKYSEDGHIIVKPMSHLVAYAKNIMLTLRVDGDLLTLGIVEDGIKIPVTIRKADLIWMANLNNIEKKCYVRIGNVDIGAFGQYTKED